MQLARTNTLTVNASSTCPDLLHKQRSDETHLPIVRLRWVGKIHRYARVVFLAISSFAVMGDVGRDCLAAATARSTLRHRKTPRDRRRFGRRRSRSPQGEAAKRDGRIKPWNPKHCHSVGNYRKNTCRLPKNGGIRTIPKHGAIPSCHWKMGKFWFWTPSAPRRRVPGILDWLIADWFRKRLTASKASGKRLPDFSCPDSRKIEWKPN